MLAVSTVAILGIAAVAAIVLLAAIWLGLLRLLGFNGEGRSGDLAIQRWIDAGVALASRPRSQWREKDVKKGSVHYLYDVSQKTEIEFRFSDGGLDDQIVVTLDDVKAQASFRQGQLMFLKFGGQTLDDTTPEVRNKQAKWVKLLRSLRTVFGAEPLEEADESDDTPRGLSQEELDKRRLRLAEKRAARGGGDVPSDLQKLAERHDKR